MHGISIEYPARPGTLYLRVASTGWGEAIYDFVCWDPISKSVIEMQKHFYSYESRFSSGNQIENQKEFYHAYCEGSINMLLASSLISSQGAAALGEVRGLYGSYTKCISKPITLSNGKSFRMPTSLTYRDGTYDKELSSMGLTAGLTFRKGDVIYDKMSFTGVFEPFRPGCRQYVTITRSGHISLPTNYNGSKNKDYSESSRRLAVVIEVGSVTPADFNGSFKDLYEVSLGALPSHLCPSNLTDRIYSQLIIPNVNNIENMTQLKEIKQLVPQLKSIVSKHNIKSLAELYLMWKYTYSTTAMDLAAYWQYFSKLAKSSSADSQIVHLSTSEGNKTTRYTISFHSYSSSIFEMLGLNFTSANVWDTLPFSFIVDWFIGIGDTLQRLHEEDILADISVRYCTTSSLVTEYVTLKHGPFKGSTYSRTIYNRTVDKVFPTPDVDVVFKNPIRHIFDGSALVVANRRH